MNVVKIMIAMIVGAALGVAGTHVGKNTSKELETDITETLSYGDTFPIPWSETDLNSVIENANSSFIVPSVILVGAFGDYLLVPNRFNLQRLDSDGVRFSAGEILDSAFGMTEFRSGSIAIFDLSSDNLNATANRESRDRRAEDLTNCYGIDIVLDRFVAPSNNTPVLAASMYKDDLWVLVTQGGTESDFSLWKNLLSRFVDKSGDEGQCLDSINYFNL